MATATTNGTTKQKSLLDTIFPSATACTEECFYKCVNGQYILDTSKANCTGSTTCPACEPTGPDALRGLVLLLGRDYFPDPDNISLPCACVYEDVVQNAIHAIKNHFLLKDRAKALQDRETVLQDREKALQVREMQLQELEIGAGSR